jgi:GDP-L-fucose synthase
MNKEKKIYVAGHNGMVGSSIIRKLNSLGYRNILIAEKNSLDLLNQKNVFNFLSSEKPDYIFLAAARAGGINANNIYRADFIYENLCIQNNVIGGAFEASIKNLCFLGSSCIYPKNCKQPIKEDYLLSGALEKTNEPYAIAKIAGLKLCESFNKQYETEYLTVMPTNLYGPKDNYNLETSHVLPALIRKAHEAKIKNYESFKVWGSGNPKRELLHVDDLSDACVFLMEKNVSDTIINIGSGDVFKIKEIAEIISEIVEFKGKIEFDKEKPDGTPEKTLDSTKINNLGWQSKITFKDGVKRAYDDFMTNYNVLRK